MRNQRAPQTKLQPEPSKTTDLEKYNPQGIELLLYFATKKLSHDQLAADVCLWDKGPLLE